RSFERAGETVSDAGRGASGGECMSSTEPRYIVVEGPIGVGKTNLARRLAQSYGSELLLEEPGENPFLERFYRDPRQAALQTQLYFLFQRARQLRELRQGDTPHIVRVA